MNATMTHEAPVSSRYADVSVNVIAVPVKSIRPEAGISVLLKGLSSASLLPVTDKRKRLIGVIRDQDVLVNPTLHPEDFRQTEDLVTLSRGDTVEKALEAFSRTEQTLIPILDARGRYTGECASRTLLLKLVHGLLRPARVGGLATPLGVYMTSGYYSAGPGWKGLVATGVLFAAIVTLLEWVGIVAYSAAVTAYPGLENWNETEQLLLQVGFMLVGMLSLLRMSPMAGLHAAEHMTINAIEQDLDITDEIVRTQPREHQRCGTNLMVFLIGVQMAALGFISMQGRLSWLGLALYCAVWLFLITRYWRTGGLWLQRHFTTKNPTSSQLASGMKAGRELLDKFAEKPHANPTFLQKLWGAGLFHMLASFLATSWLLSEGMSFLLNTHAANAAIRMLLNHLPG